MQAQYFLITAESSCIISGGIGGAVSPGWIHSILMLVPVIISSLTSARGAFIVAPWLMVRLIVMVRLMVGRVNGQDPKGRSQASPLLSLARAA